MPLACINLNGSDVCLFMMIFTGGIFGIAFFAYLPFKLIIRAVARQTLPRSPASLYVTMLLSCLGCLGLTWAICECLAKTENFTLCAGSVMAGFFGWLITLLRRNSGFKVPSIFPVKQIQIPRLQAWTQDLVVAALSFGVIQAIAFHIGLSNSAVLPSVVYLLSGSALSLIAALNVCRHHTPRLPSFERALLISFTVAVGAVTLIIPLFVEWRWRRNMNKMGMYFKRV